MTRPGTIIATVDIGSNAIRYRAFAYSVGMKPVELDRARYPVQLGGGTFHDGRLADADIDKAMTALKAISRSALGAGASRVVAVATSAVREAANAREFIALARETVGIEISVVSAEDEARLAALGASCGGTNRGNAYMIDIGGGSTEVVALGPGAGVRWDVSLPLGAVRLAKAWNFAGRLDPAKLLAHYDDVARIIAEDVPGGPDGDSAGSGESGEIDGKSHTLEVAPGISAPPECWALGGTPGALEQMLRSDAFRGKYGPREISRDRAISGELFALLYSEITAHSADELHDKFSVDARRSPLLLPGAVILRAILDHLQLDGFIPGDAGICEGLAWAGCRDAAAQ